MYDVDKLKDKIAFYKNAKKTRPGYKRALEERARVSLMVKSFLIFLEERVLKDDYRNEILLKVDLCDELIFVLDVYILETKIFLNIK